jgi:dihydroflavonol-4-reductase
LVTGGSGFLAGYCIIQLLDAGYDVRTTVRNVAREAAVRATLASAGVEPGARLSFAAADLERDAGWAEAVAGCEYVLHVASPFPAGVPKNDDELIVPARDGALRVLRAARDAGVKRVVLTSSFAAVGYGHAPQEKPFDETDWTDLSADGLSAYVKSKTIAERAAWDFIAKEGGTLELSVVNPVAIFGPVLAPDLSTSIAGVQRLMDGTVPGSPRLYFGVVDVRDTADLHVRAMTNPAAKGERFLAASGAVLSMLEMAKILKERLGVRARRVPTRQLPDWLFRLAALRDPMLQTVVPELGRMKGVSGEKATRVLGWSPRSREDALVATAESLYRLGLLKDKPEHAATA